MFKVNNKNTRMTSMNDIIEGHFEHILHLFLVFLLMNFQALTNQILNDVHSRTLVLHYLFVNILPY